jgi:hypothetical protein
MIETVNSHSIIMVKNSETGSGGFVTNPGTLVTEGTQQKINITDSNNQTLMDNVLKELRIMNIHLAILTDNYITQQEII